MNPEHNITNSAAAQSIDRILGALRDAAPPAGMESRILRTLELESRAPASPSRQRFGFAWMTATCCAALAVATLFVGLKQHHRVPATTVDAQRNAMQLQPISAEKNNQPTTTASRPTATHHDVLLTTRAIPKELAAEAPTTEYTAGISHPAPPIPLTEQEKLLLHYAQHGHTSDLAQISNEKSVAKDEQEEADFLAFFTPPPPPPLTGESE